MPIVPARKSSRHADPKATLAWQLEKGIGFLGLQTEFRFHPTRKWRFDLAIPTPQPYNHTRGDSLLTPCPLCARGRVGLAIEIEGGLFLKASGRHNRGAGMRADLEKYNEALILGWRVLRVLPEWVASGKAFGLVERALKAS